MDAASVRQQLREVNAELARLDQERDVLLTLARGLEAWLALHGGKDTPDQPQLPLGRGRSSKPAGALPLRAAILQVVRDARGQPLHAREILARTRAMGADTSAKKPESVVDLVAYSWKKRGEPLERSGPMTWRWAGDGQEGR